ncbi:MAG: YopJ family acetyltransferase [Gammaproteobacteria bacterium]
MSLRIDEKDRNEMSADAILQRLSELKPDTNESELKSLQMQFEDIFTKLKDDFAYACVKTKIIKKLSKFHDSFSENPILLKPFWDIIVKKEIEFKTSVASILSYDVPLEFRLDALSKMLKEPNLKNTIINDLLHLNEYNLIPNLLKLDESLQLVTDFLLIAIQRKNALVIQILQKESNDLYLKVVANLGTAEKEQLDILSSSREPKYMSNAILPFMRGFGNLYYKDGLLTAAEVRHRQIENKKDYEYTPTILNEVSEFNAYLLMIKNCKTLPINERFVIADTHWISGQIKVNENKQVEIVFIDPSGAKYSVEEKDSYESLSPTLIESIKLFNDIFHDIPAADKQLYFDPTKRQHDTGCSVFALDDCRHLFTVEKYMRSLPEGQRSLFDYLKFHKKGEKTVDGVTFTETQLPISFLRTKQSSKAFTLFSTRSEQEQKQKINKKGLTAAESTDQSYRAEHSSKKMNLRLKDKLTKMADHNFHYLFNTPSADVEKAKEEFTLAGFKKRMG